MLIKMFILETWLNFDDTEREDVFMLMEMFILGSGAMICEIFTVE